jgi:hypothetical protein
MPKRVQVSAVAKWLGCAVSLAALIVFALRPALAQQKTATLALTNKEGISEIRKTQADTRARYGATLTRIQQDLVVVQAQQTDLRETVKQNDAKAQEDRRHMLTMIQKILLNQNNGN